MGERNDTPAGDGWSDTAVLGNIDADVEMVYEALSHRHRRYLLYALRDAGGQATHEELCDRIEWYDRTNGEESTTTADRLGSQLYHVHIPKLAACGLVESEQWAETDPVDIVRYACDTPVEQLLSYVEAFEK